VLPNGLALAPLSHKATSASAARRVSMIRTGGSLSCVYVGCGRAYVSLGAR
jgi:hypothetical protein